MPQEGGRAVRARRAKGKLFLEHPRDEHEKLGCESCHGPAKQHVRVRRRRTRRTDRVRPQEAGAGRRPQRHLPPVPPEDGAHALAGQRARVAQRGCTDCHTLMHAGSERGNLAQPTVMQTCGQCHQQKVSQLARFSHMPITNGKLECSTCHNPHGSPNDKLLLASSVNQTCFTCHAEKRGPFLYEHAPVVENCANCHDPHGSNKEKLLKVSRPRLCQQCHPTAHGATTAKPADAATVRFVYNKGCVNCHVNLHGSNHPAGAFFTR